LNHQVLQSAVNCTKSGVKAMHAIYEFAPNLCTAVSSNLNEIFHV